MSSAPAIVSPRWDALWLLGPGIFAALFGLVLGLWFPSPTGGASDVFLWVTCVLLVDVAHVYASLYRTYLDADARRHHGRKLLAVPLLCAWFGFLLHLESPLWFWRVLAYVAIFHFIQQHVGFALLYARKGGEGELDRKLCRTTIWVATAGPMLYWHANLPRSFAWFIPGDLAEGLPPALGTWALVGQAPIWIAFFARRLILRRRGHKNPLLEGLVLVTALNWHLGIVLFDDDRVFTVTNVITHGVPYFALVWIAGGRTAVERVVRPLRSLRAAPAALLLGLAFYGFLAALAVIEEALWDRLVWHDHPGLFGAGDPAPMHPIATALIVSLLTVPQATHYVLDRFIWRVGASNPHLKGQLGL